MSVTLDHLLSPLAKFFDDTATEEICINGPDNCFVYSHGAFRRVPFRMKAREIEDIAIVAAAARRQDVGHHIPLLATDLSGRGRLQAVLPPCVPDGRPSLTIRRGSNFAPTIATLASSGIFSRTVRRKTILTENDARLVQLHAASQWEEFLYACVRAKKTIVVAGETGSGKTTIAKGLADAIDRSERIITIEDTPEWEALQHENRVSLLYDKNAEWPSATHLVEASLRMRIGRLLLQEIRDGTAAIAFLTALQTGHPGGITTIHANSAEDVFDRLRIEIKKHGAGRSLDDSDIMKQLRSQIDVIVHCARAGINFWISEVWFSLAGAEVAAS